jgi:hypothetical protein
VRSVHPARRPSVRRSSHARVPRGRLGRDGLTARAAAGDGRAYGRGPHPVPAGGRRRARRRARARRRLRLRGADGGGTGIRPGCRRPPADEPSRRGGGARGGGRGEPPDPDPGDTEPPCRRRRGQDDRAEHGVPGPGRRARARRPRRGRGDPPLRVLVRAGHLVRGPVAARAAHPHRRGGQTDARGARCARGSVLTLVDAD